MLLYICCHTEFDSQKIESDDLDSVKLQNINNDTNQHDTFIQSSLHKVWSALLNRTRNRSFTLVELCIVIAMIDLSSIASDAFIKESHPIRQEPA